MELTPKQKNKLKQAILDKKVTDEVTLGVFRLVSDLEDKVDEAVRQVKESEVSLDKVLASVRGTKGEDGKTPQKGQDYFDGQDYVLTEFDKQEIASNIKVPIVEKKVIVEKTEVIKEQPIITEVTKVTNEIKEVAIPEKPTEIRDKLETLKGDERLDISAIKGFGKRIAKLSDEILNRAIGILDQRTSFLIQKVSNLSDKVNNLPTSSSGGLSLLPATGVIDGSNTVFTFTSAPSIIIVDGIPKQKTQSDSEVNWTGTTSVTLLVAPNFDIFGM